LYLPNLIAKVGSPLSYVNIVNGYGKQAGAAIVANPSVDKIAFTRGTAKSEAIMWVAIATMRKIMLEIGGKSPVIISEDADLEKIIKRTHYDTTGDMGQLCISKYIMLIYGSIYDGFLSLRAFVEYVQKVSVVDDPYNETSYYGPQVSHRSPRPWSSSTRSEL
jgi:aldehyde dehydrogenase (NAD+)